MKRAYGLIEIKSMDDSQHVLEGTATTPTPDRMGDVVEPEGAVFKLPIPLLWQHDSAQPVGHVTRAKVTKDGIAVVAKIASAESPTLRARLEEAWDSVKSGLVRGFSIGFRPIETARIEDTYSYRYTAWEWLELSLVTIPANSDATISAVKSIDQGLRAASGRTRVVRLDESNLRRARRESRPGVVYLDR